MFTTRDPIGLMGGMNVFQYAPNPIGWIDPFGLSRSFCTKSNRWRDTKTGRYTTAPRGHSGKQRRLRELMNDPKVSKADRGWLRNDLRHIKFGNKKGLRVPRNGRKSPGRKKGDRGYEMGMH